MRRALLLLVLLPAGASCRSDPGPLPDVDELLARSAAAMRAVDTAEFEMTVSGARIAVSGLGLRQAEGVYVAPDRAQAVLSVRVGDLTVQMATISIGNRTWVTDPLTGGWSELDPGTGFNPAIVFGDQGWEPLLTDDLDDATLSHADGGYLVEGTAPAVRVATLTSGLVRDQDVAIALLVDRDTARLVEARFSTTAEAGTTDWLIRLGPYGQPATVEPPVG
jgi:hypothetical protein